MFLLRLKIKAVTLLQELRLKKKKQKQISQGYISKKKKKFINEFRNIYIHIYITVAPLQVPFFPLNHNYMLSSSFKISRAYSCL